MAAFMFENEFFSKNEGTLQEATKTLVDIGCCTYCVLRFLGEKQLRFYRRNEKAQTEMLIEQLYYGGKPVENISRTEKPCITCLGILQNYCTEAFSQKIIEKVKSSGYVFSTYFCSLMLPVSLIVRQHSVYLHLREKFSEMYHGISDDDIPAVKEVWKWHNGPILSEALGVAFNLKSPFEVHINFTYKHSDRECSFLTDFHPDIFRRRKTKKADWEMYSRANVAKAVGDTVDSIYKRVCNFPPALPSELAECERICCQHESVFIAGRYNKYSRLLSQTPWLIEGIKKHETSVQELICTPLMDRFQPVECKFSASGREDVDVKMLGNGRPFVIELVNPKKSDFTAEDFLQMQKEINTSTKDIFIRDLQAVSRDEIANLKEGEIEKTKSYSATCWSENCLSQDELDTLSTSKDLVLLQKTPIRVLHRRPLASRQRVIHSMSAKKTDDHHFCLHLSTQAGTYVKEFIHGDFGRTQPNLSIIMKTECDILELDVESVDVDWPKQLNT